MKVKTRKLLKESKGAINNTIEFFNRPSNIGRTWLTLSCLNHAFEMLMKSIIFQRNGSIDKNNRSGHTIGYDKCIEIGLSNDSVKFLDQNQAIVLRDINTQRDALEHYLTDITERHLYYLIQSGVTLYADIFMNVYNENLSDYLPKRVFPISVVPLTDISTMFRDEVESIRKLIQPNKRQKLLALMKVRALAITNNAVLGRTSQPSDMELDELLNQISENQKWFNVFQVLRLFNLLQKAMDPK